MEPQEARAKDIFLKAVEIGSTPLRSAFLEEACIGDSELRSRVDALIEAHERPESLLDRAVFGVGPEPGDWATTEDTTPFEEGPGTIIGSYKLLEQIGEGGMGVVFMADQSQPVRRRVALKVIKPGMDTRQVIARFEAERQALALMDHPNIARIFDGGVTESGRPYFVMELVKGLPITDYCDLNRLTPRQRLELFLPVCQAVQHAHQKGIIHRDLKPSNVLVSMHDATPLVKVIDFGVAKALGQELTDKTLFTGFAQMVGTPLYMSPEQAGQSALDTDTRSDIYTLGVLLYELLTGTTPFDKERFRKAAYEEIRRIVREEEPPRPSTRLSESGDALSSISALRDTEPVKLTKLVRGELDWIVMKTLEKDRNRRYESASGLAADLCRFLNDEPVAACPPSAGYRMRKFASRNRGRLLTSGAIGVATLGLIAALAWSAWDRHTRSIQQANEKSARAAVLSAQLRGILSDITRHEQQQAWPEALAAARRAETAVEVGDGNTEIAATVRRHVAELQFAERLEAARSMRDVDAGPANFDGMRQILVPEIANLRPVSAEPANVVGIERAYNEAFAAFGVDLKGSSTSAASNRLRQAPGILQAVATALDDWAAVRRENFRPGAKHLSELALAIDDDPFRRRIREAILNQSLETLRRLGKEIPKTPQPATTLWLLGIAQPTSNERADLLLHAQAEYPADFWINFHLGFNLIHCRPSQQDHGARFLQAALALRPSSRVRAHLVHVLTRNNRIEEAEVVIRKGLSLSPLDPSTLWARGFLYIWQNNPEAALAAQRTAVALDPGLAPAHVDMGLTLILLGRFDEAIEACRKAIEIDPTNPWGHFHLGTALRGKKQYSESIAAYELVKRLDPDNPVLAMYLGGTIEAQSGLDGLIAYWRREMELNPKGWRVPLYLGIALARKGHVDEGLACLEKSISLNPTDPAELALAHYVFGSILSDKGRLDEAILSLRKGIEIQPRYELGPKDVVSAHVKLGAALRRQGKLDEAIAAFREAIEIDPRHVSGYLQLSRTLYQKGESKDAITWLEKATAVDPVDPSARNGLAWYLATSSSEEFRNPALAVKLAREAVGLAPTAGENWNTLGVAQIRAGDPKAAIVSLEKSMELRNGGNSFDLFFLAMAYWQLGDRQKAQSFYDQAVTWMDKNAPKDEELIRFRAEALHLMTVETQHCGLGKAHIDKLFTTNNLACLYQAQGQLAKAEPLQLAEHVGIRQRKAKIPKQGEVRPTEAIVRLVRLDQAWDQPENAAE
jgi:serine/threonine protein kinase/tetratricopeptide (TPR) repeat protein